LPPPNSEGLPPLGLRIGRLRNIHKPSTNKTIQYQRGSMKKLFLCFLLLISAHAAAAEGISPEKKILIDKLVEQMGQSAVETGKQFSNLFIQNMSQSLKQAKPDIDPKAFDILEEEVKLLIHEIFVGSGALAEMMYPIYGKRFSEDELNQLIRFYSTPLGKKLVRELPAITREGIQAGQKLSHSLIPKLQERLQNRFKEEGLDI